MKFRFHSTLTTLFLLLFLMLFLPPEAGGSDPPARRIVSLAPSITETLFAIGAGERIAGVTDHDVFPDCVRSIPSVGGYFDPSLERILSLSPDLVIGIATFHSRLMERLESLGVQTLPLTLHRGLDGVRGSVLELGAYLGLDERSQGVWNGIEEELESVRMDVASLFPGGPPSLLVVVWHDPLTVAGGVNYIDDILGKIGIPNAASDIRYTFPQVDPEGIVSRDPDVILVPRTEKGMSLSPRDLADALEGFPIRAVKKGRIAVVSADLLFHPGPRVGEAARSLLDAAMLFFGDGYEAD